MNISTVFFAQYIILKKSKEFLYPQGMQQAKMGAVKALTFMCHLSFCFFKTQHNTFNDYESRSDTFQIPARKYIYAG